MSLIIKVNNVGEPPLNYIVHITHKNKLLIIFVHILLLGLFKL